MEMRVDDWRTWKLFRNGDFVIVTNPGYWQSCQGYGDQGAVIRVASGTLLQVATDRAHLLSHTFRLLPGVTFTVPNSASLRFRRAAPLEVLAFGSAWTESRDV